MNCPHCGKTIDPASVRAEMGRIGGSVSSPAKTAANRAKAIERWRLVREAREAALSNRKGE